VIRLFVAIDLPSDVRERVAGLCGGVPGVNWQGPEQLHLTLRFIGDIDEPMMSDIDFALANVQAPSFDLALEGVDVFADRRRARVLWVGVRTCAALDHLQSKIDRALVDCGIAPEGRRFRPHVTLARLGGMSPERLAGYLAQNAAFLSRTFPVAEFTLFSSWLGRSGASYAVEAVYPLDRLAS
jgi:2'-5' RNA ligase